MLILLPTIYAVEFQETKKNLFLRIFSPVKFTIATNFLRGQKKKWILVERKLCMINHWFWIGYGQHEEIFTWQFDSILIGNKAERHVLLDDYCIRMNNRQITIKHSLPNILQKNSLHPGDGVNRRHLTMKRGKRWIFGIEDNINTARKRTWVMHQAKEIRALNIFRKTD